MDMPYYENEHYEKLSSLAQGEYVDCSFVDCNFAEQDMSGYVFDNCRFRQCNLSLSKTAHSSMRQVSFSDCKMLGIHFEHCNPFLFSVSFERCLLRLSSFYKMKLKGQQFLHCDLQEVDFTEADLSNANFADCNLLAAVFDQTLLEKADFRSAYNYQIIPENNRIKKAKFAQAGLAGLLLHYDIVIA